MFDGWIYGIIKSVERVGTYIISAADLLRLLHPYPFCNVGACALGASGSRWWWYWWYLNPWSPSGLERVSPLKGVFILSLVICLFVLLIALFYISSIYQVYYSLTQFTDSSSKLRSHSAFLRQSQLITRFSESAYFSNQKLSKTMETTVQDTRMVRAPTMFINNSSTVCTTKLVSYLAQMQIQTVSLLAHGQLRYNYKFFSPVNHWLILKTTCY